MKQTKEEMVQAIAEMIRRSEKAQQKFTLGTSQHTLLKNRMNALKIAMTLLASDNLKAEDYSKENLERAEAPLASLISKNEKTQQKLKHGTWQYTMIEKNLQALYNVFSLLQQRLEALTE